MVCLDGRARSFEADALDNVRVERPLEQPLDLSPVRLCRLELCSLRLKHVDERVADDLALLFWVFDALQAGQEEVRRVDDRQVHAEILVEHLVHLRRLVSTEYAVVDHDGVESGKFALRENLPRAPSYDAPVSDGFMHQFRSDCAVNAPTNGADNPTSFTADLAYANDFLPYKLLLSAGDVVREGLMVLYHHHREKEREHVRTMVQWSLHPQMLCTNREMTSLPRGVCVTSG